jgi:hypothetical protein
MLEKVLGMARPVKILTHDGEDWQAILTGGCTCREGYTVGVLFLARTTNREAFGRLRGIPPERFDYATVDQLRETLIGALSGDDD